jgi:hypothetical protein
LETYINQYDDLFRTLQRLTLEFESQTSLNSKTESEVQEQRENNSNRKKDDDRIIKETNQLKKMHELALITLSELEQEKSAVQNQKEETQRKIHVIQDVEIMALKREMETQDKQISSLKSESDVVKKRYGKGEKANKALYNLINLNIVTRKNLYAEVTSYDVENRRQKEDIRVILQEKDHYDHDVEIANQR